MTDINQSNTPKPRKRTSRNKAAPKAEKQSSPPVDETPLKIPLKVKGVWSFINTNSGVLDLFVNTLTFLIVACFGTWLLFKQNGMMERQNALVEQQMSLDEASRRSALIALMSNIMDKVDDEIKEQKEELRKKGLSRLVVDTMKFSLSQSLIGQISALSHSFKPYKFIQYDTLIDRRLSPERGQLLITLTRLPLDAVTYKKICIESIFQEADLSGAKLSGVNFSGVNLRGADLIGADLRGADLRGADLRDADLEMADLRGADLEVVNLRRANLAWADLEVVDLRGADLKWADLRWADLRGAHLNILQSQTVKTLYRCRNLHDSLSFSLLQTHPYLFERPKSEVRFDAPPLAILIPNLYLFL